MTEISRKKITFDFDNDNRPMREDVAEGTLFEPQYKQALRQIDNYLYELRLEKTELKDRDNNEKKSDTEYISDDIDYNNNIFSFIGDRGTGKTSCMISVASILQNKEKIDKKGYPNIDGIKFTNIDLIDPAYFDKSHNLLSLFLAKLYKSFVERIEKDKRQDISRSEKQEFLKFYREAHSQLHRLFTKQNDKVFSDEDLLEYVEEVSASVKLKRTIQDLVDAYLDCFHCKDTILILRIDDVDMSIDHASEMIETMRKYFVQPNLLVFVSGDLDQLWKIKTRDFIKEFPDPKLADWCRELADKYLSKVFPNSHRILMPEPASYHNYKLRIKGYFKTDAGKEVSKDELNDEKNEEKTYRDFVSVQQAVPELILKKTRYLFYNTNYYESYIVPRNLRELRQLMKLLITMPDYKADGREHPHNKTLFKEYFYNTWVQSNLQAEDKKLVPQLLSVRDISLFNKTLLGILKERFDNNNELKVFPDLKTRKSPVSTSEVLSVISAIEPTLIHEIDRKLVFFIKSYYSMLLYDTYREIVNDLDNGNRLPNKPVKGVDGNIIDPIIRRDPLCEFYDFEKLVAGSFILLGSSLDNVAVNVNRLREYVEEAKKICSNTRLTKKQEAKVLLTELIVLSIHYFRANSTSPLANDLFDQFKQIPKGNDQSQVVINVGALLFNLTRYQQSLDRFDAGLYAALNDSEKCKKYKSIWKRISEKEGFNNYEGWLHRITLRNFEVLQDIKVRFNNKEDSKSPNLFFEELDYLSKYSFPLYEHPQGEEKHYFISLTFLKHIMEGLKDINIDNFVSDKLFDNSQNPKDNDNATGNTQTAVSNATGQTASGSAQAPK